MCCRDGGRSLMEQIFSLLFSSCNLLLPIMILKLYYEKD